MKFAHSASVLLLGTIILLCLPNISAQEQKMDKIDEDDDVVLPYNPLADKPQCTDDLEIISASVDWSGNKVLCEFTVKGEVVNVSSDGTNNTYYFNLDITTETDEEEIWFTYTFSGFTGASEIEIINFCDEDFSSVGSTFTFEFDIRNLNGNPDILDLEVRAMNEDGWIDEIQWDEGFVDDDDDTDDDTSDDDDNTGDDDDTNNEEDDSPGFSLMILLGSVLATMAIIGSRRRRD